MSGLFDRFMGIYRGIRKVVFRTALSYRKGMSTQGGWIDIELDTSVFSLS